MPVEKLRLRPWLENALNTGLIPGVKWLDTRDKVFQVSWKHASRQGWKLDTDACIFKEWAIHTGRYRQKFDKPDPRRWKANFRCALNALPDIKELQGRGVTRGNNAFKVYQMLNKHTEQVKDKNKHNKDGEVSISNQSKVLSKYNKGIIPATTSVIKRHSVIHKSSTVFEHSDSRHPICTTHPVNPQSLIPYWPSFTPYSPHPHMKDHDYLTTWYDPRPEMKDIGVMTYQEIKKEPGSPVDQAALCCDHYSQDNIVALTDSHYINNVKEEETVLSDEESIPDDQEIIDLVDRMSRDSDTCSNGSTSSLDEYDREMKYQDQPVNKSPLSNDTRSTPLTILKPMHTEEYLMMYDYNYAAPPPPLTPESASEILKGITTPVNQSSFSSLNQSE